ncbi:MAG: sugar phosphate isomerase/epimerase [Planctomycetes bacterium]|nr:sugar phosphate isomerase/epimerase [Planctomycetota bacterium]NOG55705.1 sugar phosphate isomerase/epimerase [Planctomycetota bacterium]
MMMMTAKTALECSRRIGVCSWSLEPTSPEDLAQKMKQTGLRFVQLALDPLRTGAWDPDQTMAVLKEAGIIVVSGMMAMKGEDYSTLESIKITGGVRPDEHWDANMAAAGENAQLARRYGIQLITFHAGFIPHSANDPLRAIMIDRLRQLLDIFDRHGVRAAFETGQETAGTLLEVLEDIGHDEVGVNFDPANMILYAMGNPVEALTRLAPRVYQVHIKDAVKTKTAGTWGAEVVAGTGDVHWQSFFGTIKELDIKCDLIIEREAGDQRVADVIVARDLIVPSAACL